MFYGAKAGFVASCISPRCKPRMESGVKAQRAQEKTSARQQKNKNEAQIQAPRGRQWSQESRLKESKVWLVIQECMSSTGEVGGRDSESSHL